MSPSLLYKIFYVLCVAPLTTSFALGHGLLAGLFPSLRPCPNWTFRQVLMTRLIKSIMRHLASLQYAPRLNLRPGAEGSRFEIIPTAQTDAYKGPLEDPEIKPDKVGATWTPNRPDGAAAGSDCGLLVLLHFHGGAYLVGDGRDGDAGFLAKTLLEQTSCTHVFTPQYRLASSPGGRFPAALQDALSAYLYLVVEMKIPPSSIVLGGDSAGGNLALALLRYVHQFGKELQIPLPAALLLWSPLTDVLATEDVADIRAAPNYDADFLDASFANWGSRALTGSGRVSAADPYLTVTRAETFATEVPVWVHTGGREAFLDENRRFVEFCRERGVDVEWEIDPDSPHDVIMMGEKLGFASHARRAASKANQFLQRVTSVVVVPQGRSVEEGADGQP